MHPTARYFKLSAIALLVLVLFVARPSVGLVQGTEVPILVVVNDNYGANPFGRYLGEILRAEGLNAYEVVELGDLTAADLAAHDLTILAETPLTSAQANLLTTYVNNGGRLLAMRPDTQIKGLFGLGSAAGPLTDGYLRIDTAAILNGSVPGQGLTGETLQIHGTADCYSPAGGAVVLAQLYSDATTATSYPAVIGASSGRAVAFTYDLARNVVYTRQGNPANADLDMDSDGVVRTIDLFQGSGGGDPWVDRDKIPIPQADEQQRLLARLVKQMVGEVRPLPQLWYFPGTAKTVLILTADAHGNPTSYYQTEINSLNARGARATFYLSIAQDPPESQPGSNNDVLDWVAQGHAFGIHPYWYHPDFYPPYDTHNLTEGYAAWDMWFGLQYPNTPKSLTVRNHQVAWEGWTDAAEIAEAHGYRLDTNFYHWGAWLQKADNSWPHGYITGSGQPMKFARADGHIINLYQQLTQLVDEQLIRPPEWAFENLDAAAAVVVSQQLIDASIGGDYAALMTQFHVDYYSGQTQTWAEGTVEYANSLGVPVWNADRWLSFTETRHDANYSNITWTGATKTLSFDLNAATISGVSLTTMLPLSYQGNPLESVRVDGSPVSYSIQTIKGVDVAFVTVAAGNHGFEVRYQGSPLPGLSINDVSVTERNSGTTQAVFTVTSSTVSTQTVSVNYATVDGSAVAPGDYSSISGTLTFVPGVITRPLTVTVQGDALDEEDETFFVNLTNPTNATLVDGQGAGTILDDDPLPGLSITDASVTEGNTSAVSAVFTVTLSAASGRVVSVTYATADGTASAGADYSTTGGVLTFTPGQTSRTITITVLGDTLDEADETFFVNLAHPTNATLVDGQGVGTILDDDPLPSLSITDASVTEGNTSAMSAVFTVTLSAASGRAVTVEYATADGTATAGVDYTAVSTQTLTFTPGQTSRTLTITVLGDALDEADETFFVNLANPTNATIVDGQGVGTILDDDPLPGLSITDVSMTEGNAGSVSAVFTVTLSAASGWTVSVEYATADGTAMAGADYSTTGGVLTFTPGQTSRTITITVLGDTLDEADETFYVNLSSPVNATIADGQGVGTILDDDPLPSLSITDVSVTEGNAGAVSAVFTVTLSAASGRVVSVTYATADGTAMAGADYSTTGGVLTFTPGQTSRTLTVTVLGDTLDEEDETFFVNLTNPTNATIVDGQGVGTIVDDDTNLPPIADAGPDQDVLVSAVVNLDGSNSTDPDGHTPLAYDWQQTGGTAVVLSSTEISRPMFTAPANPTVLTFTLSVTDALGLPGVTDSVVITVSDEAITGLSVTSSSPAMVGDSVSFTATLSSGTNVTCQWDFGDGNTLDNGPATTHVYGAAGTYTAVVTAANSTNVLTATVEVSIMSDAPPDNRIYLPLIMANAASTARNQPKSIQPQEVRVVSRTSARGYSSELRASHISLRRDPAIPPPIRRIRQSGGSGAVQTAGTMGSQSKGDSV